MVDDVGGQEGLEGGWVAFFDAFFVEALDDVFVIHEAKIVIGKGGLLALSDQNLLILAH